jgi:hypothetical protein
MRATKDLVLSVRIDQELLSAMTALREDRGAPFSEQVRRALRAWLTDEGFLKADRTRVSARVRP